MDAAFETCPGCGLELPQVGGATHPYIGASPSCWALFGEVLAREYADATYMTVHQLTVDSYAVQHPGTQDPRAIRSVWGHLVSLYWQLDQGQPAAEAQTLIPLATRLADGLGQLGPPSRRPDLTVADVIGATTAVEHRERVEAWARDVWTAWEEHRGRIAEVARRALDDRRQRGRAQDGRSAATRGARND